jgi:hypothetical protein
MFGKKRRSPEDFKEEIASHLAHEADDLRDRGKCADPEAEARRTFGNVPKLEERSYESRHWMWAARLLWRKKNGATEWSSSVIRCGGGNSPD